MTSVVRQGGIQCSRQQVAEFLRVYDPEISSERRTKRLVSVSGCKFQQWPP